MYDQTSNTTTLPSLHRNSPVKNGVTFSKKVGLFIAAFMVIGSSLLSIPYFHMILKDVTHVVDSSSPVMRTTTSDIERMMTEAPKKEASLMVDTPNDEVAKEENATTDKAEEVYSKATSDKAKEDHLKTFLEIALETGTDKVTTHAYHHAYEKYLPALRNSPIRFVEIGLGCDMNYGPGKSLDLWDRYFTHKDAHIFYLEYNAPCAEKWKVLRARVSVDVGGQADVEVLKSFVKKHDGGHFDVIIDDGGHTMVQQLTSLIHLFPTVNSGGLYILEDLQTSYKKKYRGKYLKKGTAIEYIKAMLDGFYGQGTATDIIKDVRSIDCYHEVCVFVKN